MANNDKLEINKSEMKEIWFVAVHFPEKINNYYFDSRKLVIDSILLTYSAIPDSIIIHKERDYVSVTTPDNNEPIIYAQKMIIPREIRTTVEHF